MKLNDDSILLYKGRKDTKFYVKKQIIITLFRTDL